MAGFPQSSAFPQYLKAASLATLWEGTFRVRSKSSDTRTVARTSGNSAFTWGRSQLSAFPVTPPAPRSAAGLPLMTPGPRYRTESSPTNMPTMRHSYTLTLSDALPQHQRKSPPLPGHKLMSSLMGLIINPAKVSAPPPHLHLHRCTCWDVQNPRHQGDLPPPFEKVLGSFCLVADGWRPQVKEEKEARIFYLNV